MTPSAILVRRHGRSIVFATNREPSRTAAHMTMPTARRMLILTAAVAALLGLQNAGPVLARQNGCGDAAGAICSESEHCSGLLLWRNCSIERSYAGDARDDASGGGGGSGF
jgi:hypothetical protein